MIALFNSAAHGPSKTKAEATRRRSDGDTLNRIRADRPRLRIDPETYLLLCREILDEMAGVADRAGGSKVVKSFTFSHETD